MSAGDVLMPGFVWLVSGDYLLTLALLWLVTPGMMFIIAWVFESRQLPVSRKRQFLSFFPGDLLLGLAVAGLANLANSYGIQPGWYTAFWWQASVLSGSALVAIVLTVIEWPTKAYPSRAILSPTKLYHNGVPYVCYGYIAVSLLIAATFGASWSISFAIDLAVVLLPGLAWITFLVIDQKVTPEQAAVRARSAHIEDWRPIWSR